MAATGLDLEAKRSRWPTARRSPSTASSSPPARGHRPWPNKAEAALDGVISVRTRDDSRRLREHLAAGPTRVLVIGGGFIGCEVASVCRELDIPVTLVERSGVPLDNALGGTIGAVAADMQREHGVDLRVGVTVLSMEGDEQGRLRQANLSDGNTLDVDVAVPALGAVRNTEWLLGSGLAADSRGVACDASCRAFDQHGIVLDDVFVAGDVARWPLPLYGDQLVAVEHWDNAVKQGETAAYNMLAPGRPPPARRAAGLLVVAVWRQHQVAGHRLRRRRDRRHAGLAGIAQVRRRLRPARLHRRRRRLQRRQVAAVVSGDDRSEGAVPARRGAASTRPTAMAPLPAEFPPRTQPTHSPTAERTGPPPMDPRLPPQLVHASIPARHR